MNDKTVVTKKRGWYQRPYLNVGLSLLLLTLIYKFLNPNKDTSENTLDIGGPKVELKQNHSKSDITSQSTASISQSIEAISVADPNVIEAYRDSSWKVIPTTQMTPHRINFDDNSTDRLEIRQAINQVTDIPNNQLEEWWVGTAGPESITATVSNINTEQVYRIHLQWVENQGWQVTMVERLKQLPESF